MMMHFKPQRIIEVGSGFSSAMMLDTKDRMLDGNLELTFIEPYPHRLKKLLQDTDAAKCTLIEKLVQDVPTEMFQQLQANDILFIDSSHVAKSGSDVVHLYTEVLPRLNPGVVIHVHDIYWPFEYPKQWLENRWAWNETYFLRSLLQNNAHLSIRFFMQYLARRHPDALAAMPFPVNIAGSSVWLQTN